MTAPSIFSLLDPLPSGRTAVEASAGTGKTYTLASLVVRHVAEAGVPIDEILIVTFTRAAAAELRDRVRSRLTDAVAALKRSLDQPLDDEFFAVLANEDRQERLHRLEEAVVGFDAATITTIHGFAQRMLAALGSAAPGDLDATLVDDTNELVVAVCADILATESFRDPATVDELPKLGALQRSAVKILGNPGIDVIPSPDEADSTPPAARHRRLVDRVLAEVHRRRRAEGTLSFDDVLTQLRDGLRTSPGTAAALRRRFRVALIDEFQDTDPVQWELFSTLFGDTEDTTSLVLVADPKQAIYAFRGANVHTYLVAAYEAGTVRSTLSTNWRSDGALLHALGLMLDGATFGDPRIGFVPVAAAPDHTQRRLTTNTGTPLPALRVRAAVGTHLARTKSDQKIIVEEAESAVAADLAEQVQRLLETVVLPGGGTGSPGVPVRPKDIAVLIGKHSEAPVIQSALRRRNIPAVVARGGSVLESVAATHWRWLLTALARPADPARARTVALSWFFGWSVARIDAADETELADVQEQLFRWAEILEAHGTIDLCAHVWSDSGVVARVLASPDGDRELTDLDHIASLLQTNSDSQRPTALGLLTTLTQLDSLKDLIDPDNDVTARQVESEAEAVQIMTVYVAKGLEFPVVCVPTLWRRSNTNDVVFQSPITGNRTYDVASGQQWPTKKESDQRRDMANDEALGESLRLLYVALTRAQHQTLLWWSSTSGSDATGLAHVLFGRTNGAIDPDLFSARRVALPDDADLAAELGVTFAPAGDAIAVDVPGPVAKPDIGWTDKAPPRPPNALELAVLGRTPVRTNRRWSFTAISGRAHAEDIDPEDESLGDAGAADEPAEEPEHEETGTDLPLGAVPGGAQFGTLVHEVLERTDFASDDLEAELRSLVGDALRWNGWPIDVTTLVTGLRAAIDTPLGPLLAGKRLRDFTRRDYLRELDFELRLGESTRPATDRDIGALILRHLASEDPLHPWAESLAAGLFDVELAGHLTGSIDLVLRVVDPSAPDSPPRFVVADYKTNKLPGFGRESRSSDYHPSRLPAAMIEHHYPLQALLYGVALHRYLRWRLPGYRPDDHLGGAAYLFVRGMVGAETPTDNGRPFGVFGWQVPPALVCDLSDLLDGQVVVP
jgi:exodeoxyribonuclease V beta subunit